MPVVSPRLQTVGELLLELRPDRVLRPRRRWLRRKRGEGPAADDGERVDDQAARLAHHAPDVVEGEAAGQPTEARAAADRPRPRGPDVAVDAEDPRRPDGGRRDDVTQ